MLRLDAAGRRREYDRLVADLNAPPALEAIGELRLRNTTHAPFLRIAVDPHYEGRRPETCALGFCHSVDGRARLIFCLACALKARARVGG